MTTEEEVEVMRCQENWISLTLTLDMEGKDHEPRKWVTYRSWKGKDTDLLSLQKGSPTDTWIFNLVKPVLHF